MIPYRLYYSVPEVAEYLGCTTAYIYDAIKKGERGYPPFDAILPDKVRRLGSKLTIHRSFLFPNEPDNVSQFPINQVNDTDIERIAKLTAELVLESMYLAFRKVG